MSEFLSRFDGGELIGLVAVGGSMLGGIVAIIMGVWHANRKSEMAAALKTDMLNRGMSAEEIRTVLEAGSIGSQLAGCGRHRNHV